MARGMRKVIRQPDHACTVIPWWLTVPSVLVHEETPATVFSEAAMSDVVAPQTHVRTNVYLMNASKREKPAIGDDIG